MVAGRSWKKAIEVKLAGDPGDTVDISYLFLETTGMDSLKENRHDMVRVRLGVANFKKSHSRESANKGPREAHVPGV